jgi:Raf kinase inhibitor-like YbhB/YbcL family protein
MPMSLSSPVFQQNGSIPAVHTCEGEDTPPPLAWSDVPAGTKSLALIVDDPDAPDPKAPRMTYVHWVLYDIPPATRALSVGEMHPVGAREGLNDWKKRGYGGPCPPIGRHRYFFKLYALDTVLGDMSAPTKSDVEAAMRGHILGQAELVGTYEKAGANKKRP